MAPLCIRFWCYWYFSLAAGDWPLPSCRCYCEVAEVRNGKTPYSLSSPSPCLSGYGWRSSGGTPRRTSPSRDRCVIQRTITALLIVLVRMMKSLSTPHGKVSWDIPPDGYCRGYYPSTLSFGEVTVIHLKMGYLYSSSMVSDNGLALNRQYNLLLIALLGTNFNEIWSKIQNLQTIKWIW